MGERPTCHFSLPCNDTCFKGDHSSSVAESDSLNKCSPVSPVAPLISPLTVNISFPHPVRNVFVASCCSGFNLKDKVGQIAPPVFLFVFCFLRSYPLWQPVTPVHVPVFLSLRRRLLLQRSLKICSFKWLPLCLVVNLRLQCWCVSPSQQ